VNRSRIAAAVLLGAVAAATARAGPNTVALDGRLRVAAAERGVSLRVLCDPDPHGGAISIELWVPQAYTLKDFDYEDFEGPDAPAAERALSRVTLAGATGSTEITRAAAGWFSGEDPATFVFGLNQPSGRRGDVAKLLGAIDVHRTGLTWVQTGFDDPQRELRATFPLDESTVKRLHEAVGPCLAPAAKRRRS
jgi:hypothetical protein